jgi:hypothetical protein
MSPGTLVFPVNAVVLLISYGQATPLIFEALAFASRR